MSLCVDCAFGEFCFGKDCKCPIANCDHNPKRRERLFVKSFDGAAEHKQQLEDKRKSRGRVVQS
jgi:hypothetical protein